MSLQAYTPGGRSGGCQLLVSIWLLRRQDLQHFAGYIATFLDEYRLYYVGCRAEQGCGMYLDRSPVMGRVLQAQIGLGDTVLRLAAGGMIGNLSWYETRTKIWEYRSIMSIR